MQQKLEVTQKENTTLAEANKVLRYQVARKTPPENQLQKALEDAQKEISRLSKAYRQLCESIDAIVAAGARKDRKISDLGRRLDSANAEIKEKAAEKDELDASTKEKNAYKAELQDCRSALDERV